MLDIVKHNPDYKLDSRFRGNDDIFEYSLIKRHPRENGDLVLTGTSPIVGRQSGR